MIRTEQETLDALGLRENEPQDEDEVGPRQSTDGTTPVATGTRTP